ncbi:MAG: hypothetical protein Q7J57_11925 [Gemmobacter sp.]|nr:hypothetical protein [Gemmobacter sp.]
MKSLVSVIAVALISTSAAFAQSADGQLVEVTRGQPAAVVDSVDLGLIAGRKVRLTQGEVGTENAGDVFPARTRARLGLTANDPVTVTRFSTTRDTEQAYTRR